MKASLIYTAGGIALTFGVAAAISSAQAPSPAPTPTPSSPPLIEEPVYDSYLDAPQTEGTWIYEDETGEQIAVFLNQPGDITFILRCADGQIGLARGVTSENTGPRVMSVSTETTVRQLQADPIPNRPIVAAMLDPRDPLLDAMAITKGRFAIEVEGESTLYLPAWTEVSRVIEDCR